MKWTTQNIPSQDNKVAIVTGANSGIGYETAKALAAKNAIVILACRNLDKATTAAQNIRQAVPNAKLEVLQLDLADQASVHQFADNFKAKYDRLDLLINNAGVMAPPYAKTKDGFELQFAANHLGHFTLTGLLLGHIRQTSQVRVVNVSSNLHKSGKINFDDLNSEKNYDRWNAYGQSKLANLLFSRELNARFAEHDIDAVAVSAHPGWTTTGLQKGIIIRMLSKIIAQQASMGALPTLYAATVSDVQANDYYGPNGLMEMRGYPKKVDTSADAKNPAIAKLLWQSSEQLTGTTYQWN